MVDVADIERARRSQRPRHLGMAAETEVGIAHGEQLGVDGAVRIVAGAAAFAERGVLEDNGLGLCLVALGARLVQTRHCQPSRRFHDVLPVGIVALDAVHFAFQNRMMLGMMEFSLSIQVALETRGGVLAGIDYEIGSTRARGDMFAARAVAGFAAILAGHLPVFQPQSRVWTGRKNARDSAV